MMRARVAFDGGIHSAVPHRLADGRAGLRLADGRLLADDEVVWLPPFEAGTIVALGPQLCGSRKGARPSVRRKSRSFS